MNEHSITPHEIPDDAALVRAVRARTTARVLAGSAGTAYLTATQLELRADHAAAMDAVQAELDMDRLKEDLDGRFKLFCVATQAATKAEYLLRPDWGRRLSANTLERLRANCPPRTNLQIVIGDGLSATAIQRQVPALLPRLIETAESGGWKCGRPFVVRYCRVGVLNQVGETLDPEVVVLLIGERPGLATAESLSAYMAYRPREGHSDAQRNLISNIHGRGVQPAEAVERILVMAESMRKHQSSGVAIKEGCSVIELD